MQQTQTLSATPAIGKWDATKAVPLILAMSVGAIRSATAGAYQISETNQPELRQFRFPVQEVRSETSRRKNYLAPSAADALNKIRDVFGLRMSELSQIFGVSRRAAYDWLEGATPRSELVTKIYQLNKFAEQFRDAGITNIRHFINRPIIGERTLFELLRDGEDLDRAVEIIRVTAAEEASNRKPLTRRVPGTQVERPDDLDEVSTPIFG
jgi:hypothetical protein